jgi:hypothetical protein
MSHVESFTELLKEILARDVEDANDFTSLAVTGEELRRAIALADAPPESAVQTLAEYDARLADLGHLVPENLEQDLAWTFDELEEYGRTPTRERDFDFGEDLLCGVDEVLSVAAAAERAGRMTADEVVSLERTAHERAAAVAPSLADLWNAAEERSVALGSDERFPGLYSWIERIAELSSLRAEEMAIAALRPSSERQRIIETAVDRLTRPRVGAGKVDLLPTRKPRRFPPDSMPLAAGTGTSVPPVSKPFGPEVEPPIRREPRGLLGVIAKLLWPPAPEMVFCVFEKTEVRPSRALRRLIETALDRLTISRVEAGKVVAMPTRKPRRLPLDAMPLAAGTGTSVPPVSIWFEQGVELRIERAPGGGLGLQIIDETGRDETGLVEVLWETSEGEEVRTPLERFSPGFYEGCAEERLVDEVVGTLRLRLGDLVLDETGGPRHGT